MRCFDVHDSSHGLEQAEGNQAGAPSVWGAPLHQLEASKVNTVMPGMVAGQMEEDSGRDAGSAAAPRYSRRLSDKILIAFHHACDQADFEVAEQLLHILEMMLSRRPLTPDGTRRRNMESLIAAHERLWHLRHPNSDEM
jgi:hypothetical protein